MKAKPSLRSFLALSGSALLLVSQSHAANYYWDSNGNTAGLGDTAGTWGTTLAWGSMNAGSSRIIINGTQATANTAIAVGDTVYFGTLNLALGSSASTIGIVGTNVQANRIVFGAGQGSQGVTLSGGGGAITLSNASANIVANNTGTNTIGAVLNGTTGLIKGGSGTVLLTGTNGFIGGLTVAGGGTLQVGDGISGSLTSQNLTFNNGGGTFNLTQPNTSSQGMGALAFSGGHATVTSTAASGSATQTLTFASLALRTVGSTGNFSLATNTAAASNKIVLTDTTNAPLNSGSNDTGLFFGGTEYSRYDTVNGYFRAVAYGTDTNALAPLSGTTVGATTSITDVKLNGNITAQTTGAVNTIHLNGNTLTLQDNDQVLDVGGILSNGGSITAGAVQGLTTGGEIVFNVTGGNLSVASIIQDSRLTKTGTGTLTLSGANTYTGITSINSGTLAVSGGSTIADAGAVVIADAAGTTLQLNSNETILNVTGGGFSGGNVHVQGNTLTLSSNAGYTYGGTFTGTGAGGIIKQGAGTLTLSNKNTFAGTFTLEGGAVEFTYGNDGTGTLIPLSSGGVFNMANGTTLRFNPTANLPWGTFGAQLQAANGGSPAYPYGWTFANDIKITDGTASVRVTGNENTIRFTGEVTGGTSGSQTLAIYSGGIAVGSGDRQANTFAGTLQDGSGGTLGVNVDFAGASGTAQAAFVNLSGQNTFTGPLVVTNSKGLVAGANTGGYVAIGGERYANTTTFVTGNGYLGGGNYTNTISLATGTTLTYLSSADQTLGGEISGGGALLKRGSGTLTLSTNNSYTGTTTINSGVLLASSANAVPGGLAFDSTGSAISLTGNGAILGLGAGDFSRLPSGATPTAGTIAFVDNGGFAAYGADRTVNFGGANGIVAIGSTATANIGNLNGKVLHLGSTTATHKVTVTNTLDFGAATRTIQVNDGAAAVDAEISGVLQAQAGNTTAGFTKTGDGTLVLSNTNTYTGGTTVSAGTLTVNGSLADATMSITGATVNGSGGILTFNVSGATIDLVTVSTGGTLNAAGLTVNVNGTLTEPEYVLVDATGGGSISGTFAGLTNAAGYELDYDTANQVKLVQIGGSVTFAAWRTANSAGSQTLADDHDGDGVDNGTEFFLGGDTNTTGFTALPTVINNAGTLSVTWTKHPNYTGAYGTDFVVQTSETLADPWTNEASPGTVTISGNNVTYTFPNPLGTKKFARLKVTGPN